MKPWRHAVRVVSCGALSCVLACTFGVPAISADDALQVAGGICESIDRQATAREALAARAQEQDASDAASAAFAPGKVLVTFEEGTDVACARRVLKACGAVADGAQDAVDASALHAGAVEVAVDATYSVADAAAVLTRNSHVAGAQPNYLYRLAETSVSLNDTYAANQRHLSAIDAYGAWEQAKADGSVTVAVIDTGIDMDHPDLSERIVGAYDVVGNESDANSKYAADYVPDDESGHGTHVSGIVAASSNNSRGVSGVSYNANVMPIKVFYYSDLYRSYVATSKDIAAGYSYLLGKAGRDVNGNGKIESVAKEYNVRVVNMSLGNALAQGSGASGASARAEGDDAVVEQRIVRANAAGIVTVCAAGNEGTSAAAWPSDFETCVSVIALDANNRRALWSNYGVAKDISAPGVNILSTVLSGATGAVGSGAEGYYGTMSGTSMAAPVVSGVLALVFAAAPSLAADAAKQVLYDTALDLGSSGFDKYYANGLVDSNAAVKRALAQERTAVTRSDAGGTGEADGGAAGDSDDGAADGQAELPDGEAAPDGGIILGISDEAAGLGSSETADDAQPAPAVPTPAAKAPGRGIGSKFARGGLRYKVTAAGAAGGEVQVVGLERKAARTATIPAAVGIDGCTYAVTSVKQRAFSGAGKLKTLTVKAPQLTAKRAVSACLKGSSVKTVKVSALKGSTRKLVKRAFSKWAGKRSVRVA